MQVRFVSALAVCAVVFGSVTVAERSAPAVTVDDNYILALATADDFLHAWAHRDAAAGRALLTPAALGRYSADQVAMLLQGVSSPHHESYEIGPGRKLSPAKYAFEIVLYEYLTGMGFDGPRPAPSRIVVVEVSPGRWLVDEVPDK